MFIFKNYLKTVSTDRLNKIDCSKNYQKDKQYS